MADSSSSAPMPEPESQDQPLKHTIDSAADGITPQSGSEISSGDRVRIVTLPAYIKTADPMPMLRPPTVLNLGDEGIIVKRRSADYWVVQFKAGTFLIESQYMERVL